MDGPHDEVRFDMINLSGQVVLEVINRDNNILDLSNQPTGIYLLRIEKEDRVQIKRIIKI